MSLNKNIKIFVAGGHGMVGSAIIRNLKKNNFTNIYFTNRSEVDFINKSQVFDYFDHYKFDQMFIAAAKVGGIKANNDYPVDFLLQNIYIQANLLSAAFKYNINKVLFLGSSCIYPKYSNLPIKEDCLLDGKLEPTNEFYAIAKISGIKLCEAYNKQYFSNSENDFRSIMPCNLYGIGDNYHPENSHVIPALINKFHKAKIMNLGEVIVWGSGDAKREFLYVDDLADACVKFINMEKKQLRSILPNYVSHINVGSGSEISIKQLAYIIAEIIGFNGKIIFDKNQHEGVDSKILNNQMIEKIGWKPKLNLAEGLKKVYEDYLLNISK